MVGVPETDRDALWPMVAIVGLLLTFTAVLLLAGIDVTVVATVFGLMMNVMTLVLYRKVTKIEQQTNGAQSEDKAMIRELVEALKKSPPIKDP